MSDEKCENGTVKMPFGSKISIHYNKDGTMTQAKIGKTEEPHNYFAIFDKSHVQFVIKIDNTACKDRKMGTTLELLKSRRAFVVDRGESEQLETCESFGRKFHIVSHRSKYGEELISVATMGSDLTYSEASIKTSQIKFTIKYSESFNNTFKIIVKYLGKPYKLKVMKTNTLGELKEKIEAKLGFKPFGLSFKSGILTDDTNILDCYGIGENNEIYIPTAITAMNFANKTEIGKHANKHFQIWLDKHSSITIEHLKFMIAVQEGIPVGDQTLKIGNRTLDDLSTYKFENDDVIAIHSRAFGGGGRILRKCSTCNWNHLSDTKCISEDEYCSQIDQKGIVCLNTDDKSEQEFLSTTFIEDKSVKDISFTIQMRVMGPYSF